MTMLRSTPQSSMIASSNSFSRVEQLVSLIETWIRKIEEEESTYVDAHVNQVELVLEQVAKVDNVRHFPASSQV